jgi:hypothetical protein
MIIPLSLHLLLLHVRLDHETHRSEENLANMDVVLTQTEYDKVLVLANGEMLEFDTPAALVHKEDGHYASMLETAELLAEARKQLGERREP